MPKDLTLEEEKSKMNCEAWKMDQDILMKKKIKLEENMAKAYILFLGQCSNAMAAKTKAMPRYTEMGSDYSLIDLLTKIHLLMFLDPGQQRKTHALIKVQKQLLSLQQGNMSCHEYLDQLKVMANVVTYPSCTNTEPSPLIPLATLKPLRHIVTLWNL
jgi:hypothetical protein